MLAKDMMGVGMPAEFATREGYPASSAVTAAGTTTADATVLLKAQRVVVMTASGSDGIRLPADAELMVPYIVTAKTGAGKVYPPSGASFNEDTADQSQTVGVNLAAIFYRYGSLNWVSICGAVVPA
jgi:hypothetical protein